MNPHDPLEVYRALHNPRERRVELAIERLMRIADELLNHCDKESGECSECGRICCPHEDPLHFHHDGCPSCTVAEESSLQQGEKS